MLERFLGPMRPDTFIRDYYTRFPCAAPGAALELVRLGARLRAILENPQADRLAAREGRLWTGGPPHTGLFEQGYTVLVRHAERHDDELARLARGLEIDLAGPADIHLYLTPASTTGFGWHYDAEDVFVFQIEGEKEYTLLRNTVHPFPLVETLPRDMRFELERYPFPLSCRLAPGDMLYIPVGTWHLARAVTDSLSIAAGVLSPAGVDLLDFVRRQLPRSALWRRRLPADPGELRDAARELARDIATTLTDPELLRRFMESRRNPDRIEPRMSAQPVPVTPEHLAYIAKHTAGDDAFLAALKAAALREGIPEIWISPAQASFMHILLRLARARNVLEIGTLAGYSAVWMARALPPGGKLRTIEINPRYAAFAREWVRRSDVADRIEIIEGNAHHILPGMPPGSFDAIFLDADKAGLPDYLEQSRRLLVPGGLLLIDNAFAFGELFAKDPRDRETPAVRSFNEQMARAGDFHAIIVPLGDGLWVAVRSGGGDPRCRPA